MVWKPNVTVASIIEERGSFLLVEETADGRAVLNQPAGHLEQGESPLAAVVRETLEETGFRFEPGWITGIYLMEAHATDVSYLRICFAGKATAPAAPPSLTAPVIRTCWLDIDAIRENRGRHRSPMVLRCIEDYLQGAHFPLSLISEINRS